MRTCQSCGTENPDDRDFCSCGEYLRWEPTGFVQAITPEMAKQAAAKAQAPADPPPAAPRVTPAPPPPARPPNGHQTPQTPAPPPPASTAPVPAAPPPPAPAPIPKVDKTLVRGAVPAP